LEPIAKLADVSGPTMIEGGLFCEDTYAPDAAFGCLIGREERIHQPKDIVGPITERRDLDG